MMATLEIVITGDDVGVPDVPVLVKVTGPDSQPRRFGARSDESGWAEFEFDGSVEEVRVEPRAHWWSQIVGDLGSFDRHRLDIDLVPLPSLHGDSWWHKATGTSGLENAGSGVSIGIIDTGCVDHPDLAGVERRGSFLQGRHDPDPDATHDSDGHGSHVTGIVASKPVGKGVSGMAPEAIVTSVRVFPDVPDANANPMDIAEALDYLVDECACDLINLSLGATSPSEVLKEAIDAAVDKGTLCIAAAGNHGRVEYPAKHPNVLAIGALGMVGWAPANSRSAHHLTRQATSEGYAIARFSPQGEGLDAIAPGVGIISTIPDVTGEPAYGVMDGTSMAVPAAVAALAARLAQSTEFQSLPRTSERYEYLREAFASSCHDLGFPGSQQGCGLVVATTDLGDG